MTDFLDTLERQLIDAVERRAGQAPAPVARALTPGLSATGRLGRGQAARGKSPRTPARPPGRIGPRRIALGGLLSALVVGIVALVAAGVLGGGSRARQPARSSARAVRALSARGLSARGLPSLGHSRLARLNVADPAGGAPWGMRIVHTAANLVCLQIGQLERGRLRPLGGVDGDGLVHVLPPPAPPSGVIGNGLVESQLEPAAPRRVHPPDVESCKPAGAVLLGYGFGSALHAPSGLRAGGLSRGRTIAFGLLGPDALSVRYRFDGRLRSQPVERGTGAYLIVLPAASTTGTIAVTSRDGG